MRISDWSSDVCSSDLIQFIENAFKHGSKTRGEPIKLSFIVQDCVLYFSIENTYREKTKSRDVGIGLENVRKTLELQYKNSYELLIENTLPVFSVQLIQIGRASCRERVCQYV